MGDVLVTSRRPAWPACVVVLACLCSFLGAGLFATLSLRSPASSSGQAGALDRGWTSLSLGARESIARGIGGDESAFLIHRASSGRLVAAGGGVSSVFDESGVVATGGSGSSLRLGLESVGRGGSVAEVRNVVPVARANRVSYRRAGVEEWYANGPLGVEQGVTLATRPRGRGVLTLVVGRVAPGEAVRLVRDRSLLLIGRRGHRSLVYGALSVTDASGRHVPAWIATAGPLIVVRVNDVAARYPLRIDPLVYEAGAELTASDGVGGDDFGFSVAISGDTVVVGAGAHQIGPNRLQGAAYVFTQPSNGGWQDATQTAELTASDGTANDELAPR